MFRIFQHIRKTLMEQNKIRTYTFYALGEIALVMIGILLALQVNNWNQNRIDRNATQDYESRLLEDIYEEKAIIEATIQYQSIVQTYALKAMAVLEEGRLLEGNTGSQLLIDLYQASQVQNPNSAVSTYQELISSGQIGMIGNDSLRSAIITYYNYDWTNMGIVSDIIPYRENIRNLIPNPIQSQIRQECGDTYIKVRKSLKAVLPEQCELQFDPQLTNNTVDKILKNASIKSNLRFKLAILDGRILLLKTYSDELSEIIQQMEKGI